MGTLSGEGIFLMAVMETKAFPGSADVATCFGGARISPSESILQQLPNLHTSVRDGPKGLGGPAMW